MAGTPVLPEAHTVGPLSAQSRPSLTAFDRSPRPASGRLKGSSPFDGLLRPDEPPDAGAASTSASARPAPRRSGRRQETRAAAGFRLRQALAPRKAGRYDGGNCPGCGSAPIEACRKADSRDPPGRQRNGGGATAVRLERYYGLLPSQ